ncbi:GbsR/MarR family transcriptional regulator [Pseudalkalibacillus caeni]|uniref:HTH-type transcriptional regulator n=1 Tax=Exobacillus caeni TaxID=2574798 RepID=A0A5R9EZM8_9BACL|nr:GbsR/MarR family transcriptional regulator [Pseudalkalibacillus caeni]TLS35570.1 GbsR/MarR family transcriptional regulator [Pseudalkalibacillus caeni]
MDQRDKLDQARERVIESIAQNMDLYSVTSSVGRLYGTMFFENGPMTLDEMKEKLHMSKTSMSTGVRSLMELQMVEKVWKKGERKDLYKTNDDWYKTFSDFFCIRWRKGIELNQKALNDSIAELREAMEGNDLDDEEKQSVEADLEKMQYAMEYYTWLNKVVDLFESGEIFDIVEKP